MATVFIHQIERRMGPLEPSIQERIRILSEDQAEQLGESIHEINSLEALKTWLANNE